MKNWLSCNARILRAVVATFCLLLVCGESAAQTNYWKIPEAELRVLPQFCRTGFAVYKLQGKEWLNHLCPGLYALNDAQKIVGNEEKRRYALDRAVGELSYTINNTTDQVPFRSSIFVKRGNAYEMQGNHGKAIADYQAAIVRDAKNATAYTALANLFSKMGAKDEALQVIDNGLAANPESKALLSARQKIQGGK